MTTADFLNSWLQRQYPGTVWNVTLEPAQNGISTESLPWQINRADTDRVHDQEVGVAA